MIYISGFLLVIRFSILFCLDVDVISVENPIFNAKHCDQVQIREGKNYDPLIDHLIEDECRYPVRQNTLERNFNEIMYGNRKNESVHERIRMIVVQGFIDWEKFKNDHLEVPKEFSMFDGYLFVEDINPMCSKDESLFLRICFSKNPTRRFGKPDVFPTSDGTLFQFIVEDRLLSTSNCVISKTFGRCTSKPMSIVFKLQQKRESSSETSPTTSHAPWTLLGMIFALFIFAFLISICIFLYYKSRNRENVEETDIHVKDHQLKNSLPKQELHLDFDFIDDSITFDI